MKKFTVIICVFLIFGHLMLEAGAAYQKLNDYKPLHINPFLSGSYEFYDKKGISAYWWLQLNCIEFLWCTTFFILAKIAYQYSFRLFLVGFIFFLYHLIDWFMLWYDYKTSVLFYWFLNTAVVIAIIVLFLPDKKQAVYKSMK